MLGEVGEGLVQLRLQLALVALAELLAAHFLHGAEEVHRVLAKLCVAALQVSRGDVRFVPPTDLEGTGYDMYEVTRYMFRKACLADQHAASCHPPPYLLHVLTVQIFGSCHSSQVVGFCCRLNRKETQSFQKTLDKSKSLQVLTVTDLQH